MLLITYLEVLTLKGTLCVIKSIVWPSHRTAPNHRPINRGHRQRWAPVPVAFASQSVRVSQFFLRVPSSCTTFFSHSPAATRVPVWRSYTSAVHP